MPDPRQSRGFRNRNPGNIDYVPANRWQGQVGKEPGGRFAQFNSHENGIRALAMLLTTYQDRHGLRSIRTVINRWAPPGENVTSAYVSHVAALTGKTPDASLDLHDYADLRPLVEAIITHELGGQPYDGAVIDRGLALAGVPKSDVPTPATDAAALGGVAAVAAAIAPILGSLSGLHWAVGVAAVAGIVALSAIWLLRRQRAA